jgi:gliding motility-associated-like protein
MKLPLEKVPAAAGDTLAPVCPGAALKHSCNDISAVSARPGYIRNVYTGVISLPFRSDDWIFYYWHPGNGRGNTSINLCDSWVAHTAALCQFSNLERYDNSSPRFGADAFQYLLSGQPARIYNGVVDPDLDSLVVTPYYSLGCVQVNGSICPNCGLHSEIPFVAGYSLTNPVNTFPTDPYKLNPANGTATFTPSAIGNFAFAFKCEEYDRRTGKLTGFVIRDIALPITYYTGGGLVLDSLPRNVGGATFAPPGGNALVTCPGTTVSFDLGVLAAGGSVYMTADLGTAATGTFTVTGNGTGSPSGQFTWTPGAADIGEHLITIAATDSACGNAQYPFAHTRYTVVLLKVIDGIDAGPDGNYCRVGAEPLVLEPTVIPGISYQWTAVDGGAPLYMEGADTYGPKVNPQVTTSWALTVTGLPATCKSRDTVTVRVDTSNYVVITPASPVVLCEPGGLELDANAFGLPPNRNLSCGLTGDMPVTALDSLEIVPLNSSVQSGANPQSTPFANLATSRHQYLIRASDMLAAGMRSGTITGLTLFTSGNAAGASYGDLKIHLKCTPMTALDANAFEPGTVPVYAASGMLTVPPSGRLSFDFDAWYDWDTTQNLIVEICYNGRSAGNNAVLTDFYSTFYTSCVYTSNASGNSVCGGGVGSAGPNHVNELPRISFKYHPAPDADFQYAWVRLEGDYVSDTAAKNPFLEVTQRTKYYVHTYGRSGCLMQDSLEILFSERDFSVHPTDTAICAGDAVNLHVTGAYYHQWYENGFEPATGLSCDDCADPIARPTQTVQYTIVVSDVYRCADTLQTAITVLPSSDVSILNNDTLVVWGQHVQLVATGAEQYTWTPPTFLDNPNVATPIASPTEDILYVVHGTTSGICSSSDSVRIRVDYRGHIMVPSAFSPNGDGKNDVFRVANLTFQTVEEFRVFNRWGEEIYNAGKGGKAEWDGTWKGEPQEVGTYYYRVRVSYPDGHQQTFQGDVTLVQ